MNSAASPRFCWTNIWTDGFGPNGGCGTFDIPREFGGLYPRGIVMDNGRYHYRIIVKNRDVEIDR